MEEVFPNLNVNEQGSGMEMVGQRRQRVWVQRGETASVVREPRVAKRVGAEGKEEGRGVELSQTGKRWLVRSWTPVLMMRCCVVPSVLPVLISHLGPGTLLCKNGTQIDEPQREHFCHR